MIKVTMYISKPLMRTRWIKSLSMFVNVRLELNRILKICHHDNSLHKPFYLLPNNIVMKRPIISPQMILTYIHSLSETDNTFSNLKDLNHVR